MKKPVYISYIILFFLASCKKDKDNNNQNTRLYPLADGNKWIYVDSFFDDSGFYYGKDTFSLKPAKTISVNNQVYTPITDQYNDSIFIVRCTDTSVYILKRLGEALIYKLPLDQTQQVIVNSYYSDSLNATIYTTRITNTSYPSYKIVITENDGQWYNYKQQELFFTPGLGIIKGRDIRKNRAGNTFIYDSFSLLAYSLY
jgi:hypothetical protein